MTETNKSDRFANPELLKAIFDIMKQIFTTLGWLMLFVLFVLAIAMSSCNVTRTVTTRSEFWQKADTSVVIQTKTIETYDASKKL